MPTLTGNGPLGPGQHSVSIRNLADWTLVSAAVAPDKTWSAAVPAGLWRVTAFPAPLDRAYVAMPATGGPYAVSALGTGSGGSGSLPGAHALSHRAGGSDSDRRSAVRTVDGAPVNNSDVLVADPVLTVPVTPGTWLLTSVVSSSSNATADIRFGLSSPPDTTGRCAVGGSSPGELLFMGGDTGTISWVPSSCHSLAGVAFVTTAGNIGLLHAQGVATVINTTLLAASFLELRQVA